MVRSILRRQSATDAWRFFRSERGGGQGKGARPEEARRLGIEMKGIIFMEKTRYKAYAHWLCQAAGMGSAGFLKSLEQVGTPEEIHAMAKRGILEEKLCGRRKRKAQQLEAFVKEYDVTAEYERLAERGISFVLLGEEEYPGRLAAIPDAPYALYYVGKLPQDSVPAVAVVGARNCSGYGRNMARQFGEMLADAGVQVISGMARGIDGIGQQAALDAGGYSLGVLGCGVDICYPSEHRALYEKLIAEGGICSEYPPGITPRSVLFPPRNRIISGLCDGVLVIEAKECSGTLITVDMALEQGREVYALPGRCTDPLSRGCNKLIRQGAEIVVSPQEFLHGIKAEGGKRTACRLEEFPLPAGIQGKLMQLLDFQPKSMETLQQEYADVFGAHLTVPELCFELLELCAADYADQISGSYYIRKR